MLAFWVKRPSKLIWQGGSLDSKLPEPSFTPAAEEADQYETQSTGDARNI